MHNISIIPIGSGSTGNCFYAETGKHAFLIDMGIGYRRVKEALARHQKSLDNIDAIFVTHGHYDHVKAASAIANHVTCKLYTNESVLYPLRNAKCEKVILEKDEPYVLAEDFTVKMFGVPHDYAYTCGFSFTSNNTKLSYVTDCGKMNKKIYNEIKGSDVVIIEANHDVEMLKSGPYPLQLQKRILSAHGHLSNDDCAQTILKLKEDGCYKFLLAHLSKHNNTPQLALQTVRSLLNDDTIFLYACPEAGDDLLEF
ncbi:MAG: MBL fold metallo-hydrolase [Erysipelotrichaceae bacterium]|nr:MBL fold metallo-hydrolase [Erysipelotrichaceae bacterium]